MYNTISKTSALHNTTNKSDVIPLNTSTELMHNITS